MYYEYDHLSELADSLNTYMDNFHNIYSDYENTEEALEAISSAKYKLMAVKGLSSKLVDMLAKLEADTKKERKQGSK